VFVDDASAHGLKHVEPGRAVSVRSNGAVSSRAPATCRSGWHPAYVFILKAMWLLIEPTRS
jgi:hypothetical protein